jgi:AraC-like DNA-binding protein
MAHIKKFMHEYENKTAGREDILNALAVIITHFCVRGLLGIHEQNMPVWDSFDMDRAIQYMHQHFGRKLTVAGLAQMLSMSPSHFTGLFKKETGLPPMDYLIKIRIEKAKKLIRADDKMPLTEVALQCGFNSLSHFSVSFSKHMHRTPSQYRLEYQD